MNQSKCLNHDEYAIRVKSSDPALYDLVKEIVPYIPDPRSVLNPLVPANVIWNPWKALYEEIGFLFLSIDGPHPEFGKILEFLQSDNSESSVEILERELVNSFANFFPVLTYIHARDNMSFRWILVYSDADIVFSMSNAILPRYHHAKIPYLLRTFPKRGNGKRKLYAYYIVDYESQYSRDTMERFFPVRFRLDDFCGETAPNPSAMLSNIETTTHYDFLRLLLCAHGLETTTHYDFLRLLLYTHRLECFKHGEKEKTLKCLLKHDMLIFSRLTSEMGQPYSPRPQYYGKFPPIYRFLELYLNNITANSHPESLDVALYIAHLTDGKHTQISSLAQAASRLGQLNSDVVKELHSYFILPDIAEKLRPYFTHPNSRHSESGKQIAAAIRLGHAEITLQYISDFIHINLDDLPGLIQVCNDVDIILRSSLTTPRFDIVVMIINYGLRIDFSMTNTMLELMKGKEWGQLVDELRMVGRLDEYTDLERKVLVDFFLTHQSK